LQGYNSAAILEKVRESMLKMKSGRAAYERDSVAFDTIQYDWLWLLLACLLRIALRNRGSLRVIDFGGSRGSTYFAVREFLNGVDRVTWSIVEQPHFVESGKRDFENEKLKFYVDIDSCLSEQKPDATLLSGVLSYLERPYEVLEKIISTGFSNILIARQAFLREARDRLTIQVVSPDMYQASYPHWFLNPNRFMGCFRGRYDLVTEFYSMDSANIPAFYRDLFFERRNQGWRD
jgi:putative methyltransferase (TIGR04325 family)